MDRLRKKTIAVVLIAALCLVGLFVFFTVITLVVLYAILLLREERRAASTRADYKVMGAQDLVKDIVAGLFIIFEGEFRVGDIVTIGDWRGTVVEIGVRTTKIEEPGKNIKIVAQCAEGDRIQMARDLNREMKLIFDKYKINVPFPQVVVNQPVEFLEATEWQKRRAEQFAEQQREKGKDLESSATV